VRSQIAALKAVGELDGEIGALAELSCGVGILVASSAHPFESIEQPVEVLRQELLSEGGISARPCELVLGDQVGHHLAFETST
jgi:hypothetical protein